MLKKLLKIVGVVLGLFVALLVGVSVFSPDNVPESQAKFTNQLNEFRASIKDAQESSNSVQANKLQSQFDVFINAERQADFWYAKVESVSDSEDGIRVKAMYDGNQHDSYRDYAQLYHLFIKDENAINKLSQLKKGDDIFFSGSLGKEMSVTSSGRLEQPEFYLYPQTVKLSLDGSGIEL